jgi:surfactin synthase thioesterase subunit
MWTNEELAAELAGYRGTPAEFMRDPAIQDMLISILRCDYRLLDRYVGDADRRLSMGVTAFYGSDDEYVSEHDILRWRAVTEAGFDHWRLAGGHFYEAASVPELCARVETVVRALSGDARVRASATILTTHGTTT